MYINVFSGLKFLSSFSEVIPITFIMDKGSETGYIFANQIGLRLVFSVLKLESMEFILFFKF